MSNLNILVVFLTTTITTIITITTVTITTILALSPSVLPLRQPTIPTPTPFVVLVILNITLALVIIRWLLVSLATAAIAKVVQHIYSHNEENPATVRSIFKSLPETFFRIFITSLWVLLIENFLTSLAFFLLSAINPHLLESLHEALLLVAFLVVDYLFLLSQQVAVLEPESYGFAALKRSAKLVQAKWPTALGLFVIYVAVWFSYNELFRITVLVSVDGQLPWWIVYVSAVLFALAYLGCLAYWLPVTTVFYFSSKRKCGAEEQVLPEENPYQPLAVSAED